MTTLDPAGDEFIALPGASTQPSVAGTDVPQGPPALLTAAPAIQALLPAMLTPTELGRDRALGVMYGLAVGDVLGIPVEFWTAQEIDRDYPGGVVDVDPAEAQLPPDDDLAQAMAVAEALRSCRHRPPRVASPPCA